MLAGHYRIVRHIGHDGQCIVYIATDTKFQDAARELIIKEFFIPGLNTRNRQTGEIVLKDSAAATEIEHRRKRFHEAAEQLSRAKKPHETRATDFFHEHGTDYIVIYDTDLSQSIGRRKFGKRSIITLAALFAAFAIGALCLWQALRTPAETADIPTTPSPAPIAGPTIAVNQQKLVIPLANNIEHTLIPVIGSAFVMGATLEQQADTYAEVKPVHSVTLDDFFIGQCEVTQREWEAIMGNNPSIHKGTNHPVENITWEDAQTFLKLLNDRRSNMPLGKYAGWEFRLPTEAEWEYAARGGNQAENLRYSGSNDFRKVAWLADNSRNSTHRVKTLTPNKLGIYDMSGNVKEMCMDFYDVTYYHRSPTLNPCNTTQTHYRVIRGSCYNLSANVSSLCMRHACYPNVPASDLGFRIVLAPKVQTQ